jgi:hypothetical protein
MGSSKTKTIPANKRGMVVHGWAFRDHSKEEESKILKFLETGDPEDLEGTRYRKLCN